MADVFGPFDGLPWAEAQWYRFARSWAPDGILASGDLALTTSGLSVTIGAGRAWVGGAGFERTGTPATNAVTANAHATQFRRDRIVLRRSLASRTVEPVVIPGATAASPVAPAISQSDGGDWDLPLWSFLVPPGGGTTLTGLVDERRLITDVSLARLRLTDPGTSSTDAATVAYVGEQIADRQWKTLFRGTATYERTLTTSYAALTNMSWNLPGAPAGRQVEADVSLPSVELGAGGAVRARLLIGGEEVDAGILLAPTAMSGAIRLGGHFDVTSTSTVNVKVEARCVGSGTFKIGGFDGSGPHLRYRLL